MARNTEQVWGCPGSGLVSQSAFLLSLVAGSPAFLLLSDWLKVREIWKKKREEEEKSSPWQKWTPPQVTGRRGEKQALLSLPPRMSSTCPLRSPPRSLLCQTLIHLSWTLELPTANKPSEEGRQASRQRAGTLACKFSLVGDLKQVIVFPSQFNP